MIKHVFIIMLFLIADNHESPSKGDSHKYSKVKCNVATQKAAVARHLETGKCCLMRIENRHSQKQEKHHDQVYALDFYLCMCIHARARH